MRYTVILLLIWERLSYIVVGIRDIEKYTLKVGRYFLMVRPVRCTNLRLLVLFLPLIFVCRLLGP